MSEFAEDYVEQCFQLWYSLNQPTIDNLWDSIPLDANGNKPAKTTLRGMRDSYGWAERADGMNAIVAQKSDLSSIENKSRLIEMQVAQTREIVDKAREKILDDGFDSTASAVKAYFSGIEQERLLVGISTMMVQVSKMTPEELESKVIKLLRRRNESVVDGEIMEDKSADERGETS